MDEIICQNVYDAHMSTCKKRGRKRKRQIVRKEDRDWLTKLAEMNYLDARNALTNVKRPSFLSSGCNILQDYLTLFDHTVTKESLLRTE